MPSPTRLAAVDLEPEAAVGGRGSRRRRHRGGGRRRPGSRPPRRSRSRPSYVVPPWLLRIRSRMLRVFVARGRAFVGDDRDPRRRRPARATRTAIGSSATTIARTASVTVETWNRRDRTSSPYSRRATWAVFGKAGSWRPGAGSARRGRDPLTRRPRAGAPRRARSGDGARRQSSSAGRPTWSMKICSSDGSATSKWRDPRAGGDGRREDRVGLGALVELDLASGRCPAAGSARRARRASQASRWSPSTERWTIRRPVARLTRGAARRRRPGRDRRSRSTRTSPRPSPSGGSRRSASGPRRGARGTPRAGARR